MKRSCVGLVLFLVLTLWTCASDIAALDLVSPPPGDILLPRDHRVVLYLDCGAGEDSVAAESLSITQRTGQAYVFPNVAGPEGTAVYDADRVVFEVAGLKPDSEYVLGFNWWDADDSGRVQSVEFASGAGGDWQTVLPPVRVAAFSADKSVPARVTLPLTKPFIREGVLSVAFVKNAGPNAVVNELWLLERSVSDPVKRVLIVTGDDYPGHDWRSTAPALAKALREVKGLEVSYTECPAMFGSPLLSHYDAAVVHFKNYDERLPLGPECEKGLKDYVASGHGLACATSVAAPFRNGKASRRSRDVSGILSCGDTIPTAFHRAYHGSRPSCGIGHDPVRGKGRTLHLSGRRYADPCVVRGNLRGGPARVSHSLYR